MKVMTFNLRFENPEDGPNSWHRRKGLVLGMIERYRPEILGTQEGRWNQLCYLRDNLVDYLLLVSSERVIDNTCQYPSLFILKDRLDLIDYGEFWLSKTPHKHRSKDWDSAYPRMFSFALLEDRDTQLRFWASVTHLDHIGKRAREEQIKMIIRWAEEREGPIVLMGDFNDLPGSSIYQLLMDAGFMDTWVEGGGAEGERSFTHHDFSGNPATGRIDWICIRGDVKIRDIEIIRDSIDGRYPSDHFPYMVSFTFLDDSFGGYRYAQ